MDKSNMYANRYRMRSFNLIVKRCGLLDLGYNGPAYTWTNKRFTSHPIYRRLDHCLANSEWCASFPNTNVYNLPIILSDHAPILATTGSIFKRPKLSFKFENWWLMERNLRKWCRKKEPLSQQLEGIEKKDY
ncbi:hypothetical protein BRADI_1g43245v3 [Brachypodium distachyon]|uniref:Endonuclease/exonuclease/phosphatase domain-containing protein n=1 Tax=Brachypodium distachyon TaxID=15368 RepID=A0A2K2DP32_BRADI|nr:hypothetical protein BRADI_1g43245v3 [Brachypodium distachyon]